LRAAWSERLRAGQLIIVGSLTPPLFLDAANDALAFTLKPIGSVSLRLTHG
jgi:2-keto-4-pentenoate hydratase